MALVAVPFVLARACTSSKRTKRAARAKGTAQAIAHPFQAPADRRQGVVAAPHGVQEQPRDLHHGGQSEPLSAALRGHWRAAQGGRVEVDSQDLVVVQLCLQLRVVHRMQPDDVRLDGLVEQSR